MSDIFNQFKDFKSFEVVFYSKDNKLQKIYCTVKSIENNRILLKANNEQNKNIIASVGDTLKLYIYTDAGIYSADSKVLQVSKSFFNTDYIISYPANSKHSQRREYFRADLHLPFSIEAYKFDNPENIISITGETRNICGKGMSYFSADLFPDIDIINLKLHIESKIIETEATLVYSKQVIFEGRPKYIHAFSFSSISQKNIDFIVKKCFLHQLDLRKHK